MEVREAMKKRRSVRSYKDKSVPKEDLEAVLEAARLAPSARNLQDWKFVVVTDDNLRQEMVEVANGQKFVGEAPVIIAAVALNTDYVMSCGVPAHIVDLSIAVDHMTLAAADRGFGTCWIGSFSQEKAKEVLGVPEEYRVVTLFPLGYPADSPGGIQRKSLAEIVCQNQFE
ncbi:MAG: nitroreductase family protein [Halanaerobiales bacterium]